MRRTPRNFQGTKPTEKTIASLLPDVLKKFHAQAAEPAEEIFAFWRQLLGPKMGPLTEPVSYLNGVLTVKVKSSTLYSLLSQHEKPRLIKELSQRFSVRGLVFRIG